MKHLLPFIFASFFTIILPAQSLVIAGDTLVTGDANLQLTSFLTVANQSANAMQVRCRITPIINTGDTNAIPAEFSFCWGGACYGSGTLVSGQMASLAAGQFIVYPDPEAHSGYFDAFGFPCTGQIEYCFFDDANPNDETCHIVSFNAEATANLNDKISEDNFTVFYPNPAVDYINISSINNNQSQLVILDILGNELKKLALDKVANEIIYIGDLPNGIYFGRITNEEKLLEIKKIIIKR